MNFNDSHYKDVSLYLIVVSIITCCLLMQLLKNGGKDTCNLSVRICVTSPLSLRRDSFITLDLKDFFSSPNAELCLSPMKIDGFSHSGIL